MNRYRIGLMLGTKSTDYPMAIRMGVQNTLEGENAILINIADLIPYHTHARTAQYLSVAFELVGRLDLDAVIVPLGTVSGYLEGDEELAHKMLRVIDPSKVVLIERHVDGIRSITKDGRPGMHECMRHLISDCGFRRIAFVSGPETSVGAREREGVYFKEMHDAGLPVEEGMFVRGKFSGECPEVIESILDAHPDIEALCCATDLIAFTAYRVLRARGIAVGDEVAVTGFDDHPSAAHIDPPLSTVHITGYDYGCMAAREALRLCAGKPQEEFVLTSAFVSRSSCGEDQTDKIQYYRALLSERPFPLDKVSSIVADSALNMAPLAVQGAFHRKTHEFCDSVRQAYLSHLAHPNTEDVLFTSHDLARLLPADHLEYLSLEGFHAICVMLLGTLASMADKETSKWLISQISNLHLHIARVQSQSLESTALARDLREWLTFRVAEDSLFENSDPQYAHQLILHELSGLGVRHADLFMLPEPIPVTGTGPLALSDTLYPIGSLMGGMACIGHEGEIVSLPNLLAPIVSRYGNARFCTVGGVMAGSELMGVVVMEPGTLDDNGQLMAMLNIGLAIKQLQMLSIEREMNEILSKNNLALKRESHFDEMTGLLNRRGLNDGISHQMTDNDGSLCALIYIDLDGLKYINDRLGHDMGDAAIKCAAEVLRTSLPDKALIGRMGGDEFVIFSLVEDAQEAESLTKAIEEGATERNATGNLPFILSISCGMELAQVHANDREGLEQAMMRADERMYTMKASHHRSRRFTGQDKMA